MPHRCRPALASRYPVHVTLKVKTDLPNLRGRACLRVVEAAIRAAREHLDVRLVHYSVQRDHLHLLVEAKNAPALSRAMKGLCVRLARRLNKALGRSGKVFADRYHGRILRTPQEVRAVLVYLLGNVRKHAAARGQSFGVRWVDRCTSAAYFDGWDGVSIRPPPGVEPVVASPRSWLLCSGWRIHGLLPLDAGAAVAGKQRGRAKATG